MLLDSLQNLFEQSEDHDQIRLLTIFLNGWGRTMIQQWFKCSEYQARQVFILKKNKGIFAFSEYHSGNISLSVFLRIQSRMSLRKCPS